MTGSGARPAFSGVCSIKAAPLALTCPLKGLGFWIKESGAGAFSQCRELKGNSSVPCRRPHGRVTHSETRVLHTGQRDRGAQETLPWLTSRQHTTPKGQRLGSEQNPGLWRSPCRMRAARWEGPPCGGRQGADLDQLEAPVAHTQRHFFSGRKTMLNFSNEISKANKKKKREKAKAGGREEGLPRLLPACCQQRLWRLWFPCTRLLWARAPCILTPTRPHCHLVLPPLLWVPSSSLLWVELCPQQVLPSPWYL